jgi:hypothetical protein
MDWKQRSALIVLLLLIGTTAVFALEQGLNPEQTCPTCLKVTPMLDGFDFISCGNLKGTNRICPACKRRGWSNESSIAYVVRRALERR